MNVATTPFGAKIPKVNLGNFFSIKKVLDEELVEFVSINGYSEFHLFTDIRNFVVILSILCGCLAQFYFKFPDNYWGIFGCIVGYGIFTFIAQCIEWFGMNGNTHIFSSQENKKIDNKHQKFSIALKSDIKPYTVQWNLTFTSRVSSKYQYKTSVDIREIFDVNGEFVKRNFDKILSQKWIEFMKAFNSKTE